MAAKADRLLQSLETIEIWFGLVWCLMYSKTQSGGSGEKKEKYLNRIFLFKNEILKEF